MTFNFLKGVGNQHIEAARLLWVISVVAGAVYAGCHLFINHEFSIIEFGTGMGLLLAGGGGAVSIKDRGVAKAAATTTPDEAAP
jgi:hypothetical protein